MTNWRSCPKCGRPIVLTTAGYYCVCEGGSAASVGAPVATEDDFSKQAKGYQTAIRRLRDHRADLEQQLEDMKKVVQHYKETRDRELVAHAAIVGQYKLDLEATGNALELLIRAATLLHRAWPSLKANFKDACYEDEFEAVDNFLGSPEIEPFLDKPEIKALLKEGE